jgi:trk system potassium uptake protein TrkH
MKPRRNGFESFTPYRYLVLGYALVTLAGALLLSLPVSTTEGHHQPFLDSLFVATSGISTTGLTMVDIGSYYNHFGQIVLLCIVQIGGVGYMTFALFFAYILGANLPWTARIVAIESMAGSDLRMLERFFLVVVTCTLIFECAGAIVLALFWSREFPLARSLYLGVWHSISAFCTAGFGVFPDNLMRYRDSVPVNMVIILVSIAGGIGFFVLYDLYRYVVKAAKRELPRRLTAHTKLVMIVTISIMTVGAAVMYAAENWPADQRFSDKVMTAAFQSVSASTTDGFNTVDIGSMSQTSLTFLIILMFVGASPGSTGGGIKTSTLGLMLLFLWSQLRGRDLHVNLFKREIPHSIILKAFGIFTWFVVILGADMLILSATQKAGYLQMLFEAASALGNVGLSTGITPALTTIGKIALIVTMFIGRVGPLTFGLFLVGRQEPLPYRYPTTEVFVG